MNANLPEIRHIDLDSGSGASRIRADGAWKDRLGAGTVACVGSSNCRPGTNQKEVGFGIG